MPLSIPAFDQYQSPLVPLRGLWNVAPQEGDRYVNAEIDWLVTTKSTAVQFSLSGNSPVSLSQIVALAVDNSRSGADVSFIFPDSGWELVVPAHNQIISLVFTNALMFYASSPNAAIGDTLVFQILNSAPPPIPIAPSVAQNHAGVVGVPLSNGTTPIVAPPITGTLNTLSMSIDVTTAGQAQFNLNDGAGHVVWVAVFNFAAGAQTPIELSGLSVRFFNGLNLVIANSTMAGSIVVNCYYSTP
jgi:hypothetical protein